jgi:hemerythrin-like metal-binding protein
MKIEILYEQEDVVTMTINDRKIDYEHATIMQLLESATRLGRTASPEDIEGILKKVKEHIVIHFVDEEFIFTRQHPMPDSYVEMHRHEHEAIQTDILRRIDETDLASPDQVQALLSAIKISLERHILEVDAQMNRYLPGNDPE